MGNEWTELKINSIEELLERVSRTLDAVEKDDRYGESIAILSEMSQNEENIDDDLENVEMLLAGELHGADGEYPMHPEIVYLLFDIYEDCIERGNAAAMCNMGSLYYTGRAGEQNYEKAAYYYDMADKAGDRQATENLGYIYYYGRTGKTDYEKAFKYFVKGALDGHLRSLYKVGDFYKNGFYVDKDPQEAFAIYGHCTEMMTDKAVPLVGADVYMRMGDCLFEGIGVEKDLLAAQHFMSMAENLFYRRLMEGDFYQKRNLEHVIETEAKIRKKIAEEMLPDLSWAGYNE